MKKNLSNFADSLISRDQMKSIKGGCGGSWYTQCRYGCLWENSGGQYFEGSGIFGGSPSQNVGTRLPGTGAGTGLVCVVWECTYTH